MGLWDNQEEWEEPLGDCTSPHWVALRLKLAGGFKWAKKGTHIFQAAQINTMEPWQQLWSCSCTKIFFTSINNSGKLGQWKGWAYFLGAPGTEARKAVHFRPEFRPLTGTARDAAETSFAEASPDREGTT